MSCSLLIFISPQAAAMIYRLSIEENQCVHKWCYDNKICSFISEFCTFSKTGEVGIEQKLYNCVTCKMEDGHCICEICIKNCHQGHTVSFSEDDVEGFCDCGEEGSRGIRSCNMLKGKFCSFYHILLRELLPQNFFSLVNFCFWVDKIGEKIIGWLKIWNLENQMKERNKKHLYTNTLLTRSNHKMQILYFSWII